MEKGMQQKWLPALGLVMLAHAGAWYGLSQLKHGYRAAQAAAGDRGGAAGATTAAATQGRAATARAAQTRTQAQSSQRQAEPVPRPLLPPQPEPAERAMEQAPVPVAPAPPPRTGGPGQGDPEPVLEAPRFNAAYLNNPPPAYPLAARRRGIEGRVLVRAEVQADGSCSRVEMKTAAARNCSTRPRWKQSGNGASYPRARAARC